jgi:integrase
MGKIPVLIAATTGARRAEVLALRWSTTDLEKGRTRINDTLQVIDSEFVFMPPKTKTSTRDVPLPPFVVERLRRLRVEQAERRLALGVGWTDLDLICEQGAGQPMSPGAFTHAFLSIAKKAELEGVRLHDLRHGVATALAKSGTPALVTSKMLGHSSVSFTMQTYQHADDEMIDRAAQGLAAAFEEAR